MDRVIVVLEVPTRAGAAIATLVVGRCPLAAITPVHHNLPLPIFSPSLAFTYCLTFSASSSYTGLFLSSTRCSREHGTPALHLSGLLIPLSHSLVS